MPDSRKTIFRSDSAAGATGARIALLLGMIVASASAASEGDSALRCLAPADRAVVGASPIFRIAYDRVDGPEGPAQPRLRLSLREVGAGGRDYVFDRGKRRRGWNPGGPGEVLFRPPRPLEDGEYAWHAQQWVGTGWGDSTELRRLRVDTVAPAPVDNLKIRFDVAAGLVELIWDPVTLDEEGGSEYVTRYHVYGNSRRGRIPLTPEYRLGVTAETRLGVPLAGVDEPAVRFFKVVAEDEAGNVAGVRR